MNYVFSIDHAQKYGLEEAIMIQNFMFWIAKNKANNKHQHKGRTWTRNTTKAFSILFPFWTQRQIERILNSLVRKGVIVVDNFNTIKYDRTKWYAFKDEAFFINISPNGEMDFTKCVNRFHRLVKPIPDINTDIKPKTTTDAVVVFEEEDEIKTAIAGTPFEGLISGSAFQTIAADYDPKAHQEHQPETAAEGIKRLIRWTSFQMSDPESKPISNPIGFLRERAKKGMVKPAAVIRAEQEKEAERRNQEERKRRRQENEKLRKENEIDPDFLQEIRRITQS